MQHQTTIYGIRAVIEAINSGKTIDKVFVQKGLRGPVFNELEVLIRKHHISTSYVPLEKLNRLTKGNHQGIVAQIAPVDFHNLEDVVTHVFETGVTPLFLILDHLSDVRNLGAIIRTAECTGVHAIILPSKGGAPITADTVKTSAGAIFNIPICKVNHLKDAVYYLQASGVKVVAATEKASDTIYESDLTVPLALVMGAEDSGVSNAILKTADQLTRLPMKGTIGSLNVSVACGAFLYEVLRQRN
ncbi:23S rRNA (guanosine(2251)-2'-O)-methyltransferase RlmB [Ascidiimonas aurantiaca]|uniref:23S rRNA (guanosine(2251)-2'-O)-methyltransferase RlmB n=1 Tax=Ascidiimonas aurantiaca TaxID=1685432 RepID=UPI0030EE4813